MLGVFQRTAGSSSLVADPDRGRPVDDAAMGTQRRSIYRRLARAACPGGVAAAMAGTGGVTDKDLSRAERVTIRTALRRSNDPRVLRGQHQVADLSAAHW